MCGIFAYFKKDNLQQSEIDDCFKNSKLLNHRGPDHYGYILKNNSFMSLNRLAINDLSSLGNQPFVYEKNILLFNGEIYNFEYLRKKLLEKNVKFISKSDTEVLLHFLIHFGVDKLSEINGMFAFVFYDGKNIYCSSDIFGEKPLFLYKTKDSIIFSSELVALKNYTTKDISEENLYSYFSFGHLLFDQTFYKNVIKVIPGNVYKINKNLEISKFSFFSMHKYYLEKNKNFEITNDHIVELDEILKKNFKTKCIGERNKILLYSGGMDSFLVAKYLQSEKDLNFIYFDDGKTKIDFNSHNYFSNKIYIEKINDTFDDLNSIEEIFHQPHYSLTSLAYKQMAKKIKLQDKTIGITGLGGDEIFLGYNKFFEEGRNLKSIIDFNVKKRLSNISDKISFLLFKNPSLSRLLKNKKYFDWLHDIFENKYKGFSNLEKLYFSELEIFMPNSRCLVSDHAAMQESIEIRAAFLNIDIIKWILKFNLNKILKKGPKGLLKALLNDRERKIFQKYRKKPFTPKLYNSIPEKISNLQINSYQIFFEQSYKLNNKDKLKDYYLLEILGKI